MKPALLGVCPGVPPTGLMFIGGLQTLQAVTIIAALPSMVILGVLAVSFLKLVKD